MPMNLSYRIRRTSYWITLAAAALLTEACSTTTTQSFVLKTDSEAEAAYIAADADFSKYDKILAEDMGIFFPEDAAPSEEDQQRTRQIFRKAFLAELSDYVIVREKTAGALQVQPTLVDFRNVTGANVPKVRRELADIARPGALLFLMELKDPDSGKILARAADSASAPAFSVSPDGVTDWEAVENAVARWAGLFRKFLDENLNK